MKFFVFDAELMATALAWRLKLEGNDVRVFSRQPSGREHLLNMVKHVPSLDAGLSWVGRDGIVICGDEQDLTPIRRRGFKCYGGNSITQKMEDERFFQHKIAKSCGIKVPNAHQVKSVDEAISFIRSHPDQWVLKQMGDAPKSWNFVGKKKDGSDVMDQLEWFKTQPEFKAGKPVPFMLQEIVDGIEFATSGWWQGNDWKRRDDGTPLIEVNFEHKKSLTGNLGSTCGEAGTVTKFPEGNQKLFDATLGKLTQFLKQNCKDVFLNIDANCGIDEDTGEAWLFELTPREGYPSQSVIIHLLDMDTGKFFADLVNGVSGEIETKPHWGVVTVLGAGNYPLETTEGKHVGSYKGQPVEIPQWEKTIDSHIHPGYISYDPKRDFFRIADNYADVLTVTHCEDDISDANRQCVEDMKKIIVRAPHYRLDIGEKAQKVEIPKLEALGYL